MRIMNKHHRYQFSNVRTLSSALTLIVDYSSMMVLKARLMMPQIKLYYTCTCKGKGHQRKNGFGWQTEINAGHRH